MRLFFLLWLIIELVVFFLVAEWIGILMAVLLVVLSMIIGAGVVRSQGSEAFQRAQQKAMTGQAPQKEMMQGMAIVLGGFALMIPGFVTSIIGILLVIPGIRGNLAAHLVNKGFMRGKFQQPGPSQASANDTSNSGKVIDGEYERKNSD